MSLFRLDAYATRVGMSRGSLHKIRKSKKIEDIVINGLTYIDSDIMDKYVKYDPVLQIRKTSNLPSKIAKRNTLIFKTKQTKTEKTNQPPPQINQIPPTPTRPPTPPAPPTPPKPPIKQQQVDYEELDAQKLYEQTRKLKIENDIKENLYILREKVEEKFFEIGKQIKTNLEAIPKNISDLCYQKSIHDIEQLLKTEITRVLVNISDSVF